MANSIGTSIRETPNNIRGLCGTRVKYALAIHEGADAHIIRPRRAGGTLHFYWERVGHVVDFPYVNHPGVGKTPFLTSSMRDVCKPLGFRIVLQAPESIFSRAKSSFLSRFR